MSETKGAGMSGAYLTPGTNLCSTYVEYLHAQILSSFCLESFFFSARENQEVLSLFFDMAHMLFVSCLTYFYWHVSLPLIWADPIRPPRERLPACRFSGPGPGI